MTKLKIVLCGLAAMLLSSVKAQTTTTVSFDEDSVRITTTNYGDLATFLQKEDNALTSGISTKKYVGYFLKGCYNSADLQALFTLTHSDQTKVFEVVKKLDMREATVDKLKPTIHQNENDKVDGHGVTMLPEIDQQFKELTWWELPKLKSDNDTYSFPSDLHPGLGGSGDMSFCYTMPKLEHITINEGCTTINACCFRACDKLSDVKVIGNGLKNIGYQSFMGCSNLTDIHDLLYAGVETIYYEGFAGANVQGGGRADFFPTTLKSIQGAAFRGNYNIGRVICIPANVEQIASQAFDNCLIQDIYFLGTTFPECETCAFFNPKTLIYKEGDEITDTYVTRNTYNKGFVGLGGDGIKQTVPPMVHYRPDVSSTELTKITDNTRTYSLPDKFFGKNRTWPTREQFKTAWENGNNKKNFKGEALTGDQLKYNGIMQLPFHRADAPLPTATVPAPTTEWSTLCLPIDMAISEGTELYGLEKVTRNPDNHRVTLYFTKDETSNGVAKAWTPYLVRSTNATTTEATEDLIINHPIVTGSENVVEVKAEQMGTETGEWTYFFMGNCEGLYHKSGEESENFSIDRPRYSYYLGKLNDEVSFFYQQTDKQRVWKPYTCAVMAYNPAEIYQSDKGPGITVDDSFRDATGTLQAKDYNSVLGSDEPTAIEQIEIVTPDRAANGNIYNLDGRLVKANANTADGLPKGIYVCNGKKIIVK